MSKKTGEGRSAFKRPIHNLFLRRWLCGFVALALAWPAPAFPAETQAAHAPVILAAPEDLRLPASIGRVEEIFSADKTQTPSVYLIQDAHAVYDAQKNIAQIIHHLREHSGVTSVAFEGGSGEMDASVIRAMPDEFLKKQILEDFMRRGEFSGPAWAAVFDEPGAVYTGLEDWPLYEKNYLAFLMAYEKQSLALEALKRAEETLNSRRVRMYNADLERLHGVIFEQVSGEGYTALVQTLGEITAARDLVSPEVMEKNYANFSAFFKAVSGIGDPAGAELFTRGLGKDFQQRFLESLDPKTAEDFNRHWQAFLTGQDDFVLFLHYLKGLAAEKNLRLEFPPEVQRWVDQADVLTSLEGSRLLDETENLLRKAEDALAETREEKEILNVYRDLRLLKKLARLELRSAEFKQLESGAVFEAISAEERKLFDPALEFYRFARARDSVFLEKIQSLTSMNGTGSAAVVAGGFHRESLTESLRKKRIPYAVITPRVDSLEGEEAYETIMRGELSFAKRLKDSFYTAFMEAFAERAAAGKKESPAGNLAREWRDALLRDLASRQKLADAGAYTSYVDNAFLDSAGQSGAEELSEKIRLLMTEFRSEIEKQIFSRFNAQRVEWLAGGARDPAPVQSASAGSGEKAAAYALNASAGVDVLIMNSPNGKNSLVFRTARDGLARALAEAEREVSASSAKRLTPGGRSELRMTHSTNRDDEKTTAEDRDFNKTPPSYRTDNEFVNTAAQAGKKTIAEIRRDVSDQVFSDHEKMRLEYGFLGRSHSAAVRTVYEIFDQVVEGYNRVADEQGYPRYTGKLFVVDSPDVNGFVHSEHPDVYLYAGLLQDMERYAAKKGFALTHEFAAMILAHELSHVMQNSAYEGITYSDSEYEKRLPHEVLVMKRNAEYDADRNAIHILTKAGYSPRVAVDVLQFFADITPESTSEHSFSDHPHPSLRISEIMRAFNDSKLITLTWDEPFHPFGQDQSFLAMPSRHLRGLEEARTLEDILALEDRADSLLKIAELGRLAQERTTLSRLKSRGHDPANQKYFAQTVFGTNVMALARQIFNEMVETDETLERVAVHETGAFLADPSLDVLEHETLGFDAIPKDPRTSAAGPQHATPDRFKEHVQRQLAYFLFKINAGAKSGAEAHARKTAAYEALLALTRKFNEDYDRVEAGQFDFSAENPDLAGEVRKMFRGESLAALDSISVIPYAVMMNFSGGNVQEEKTVEFAGIRIGSISLERGSLPLFGDPPHLLGIESEAGRRRAFEIAYHSWLYDQFKDTPSGRAVKLLERLGARARDFVHELPADILSSGTEADQRLLEETREAVEVYIKTGNFPSDETLLRAVMELLTSPESPGGPAVFPVPLQLRSPLYEREKGLSAMPEDKLQSTKAFQHQHHYLEISRDSRRAAEILTDDLEREGSALMGGAKIDVQQIFRRNLQAYSPYFRKAVIREFLNSRTYVKMLFPRLDPSRYRHADVYAAFREMAGDVDGTQLMAEFMKAKQPERAAAFKPFASPAAETAFLEDYTHFFEKVLLPARGEGSFLIKPELASAYLQAKLKIIEAQGLRPEDLTVDFVADTLELLSRHTLVEVNYRVRGEVVEDDDLHEPRLGRIARSKLNGRSYSIDNTEDVPGYFFDGPLTLFSQAFFLRFLELPHENLKALARNQDRLLETAADTPRIKKGRYSLKTDTSDDHAQFILLLNGLLVRDTLKKFGDTAAQFKVTASASDARFATDRDPGEINLWVGMGSYHDLGSMILDFFRGHPAVDREAFWKELGESFVRMNNGSEDPDDMERSGTNYLIFTMFETRTVSRKPNDIEKIENFPAAAPLMEEAFVNLAFREPGSFSQPTSYIEAASQTVWTTGLKQGLFKQYILKTRSGPRSFVDVRKRPANEILRDMTENFLTKPSIFRDGMIDMLERQIMPEIHRGSQIKQEDWDRVLRDENEVLEWFFSKSMVEVPLEWMNLSENFPASMPARRAGELLGFYGLAIPALADPQRQLRYGAAAMRIWRLTNADASFQDELAAVERYFPQPTKLRDDALEELFNRHVLPGEGVTYEEIQRAQRLYSIYHRMIFEQEASSADAAVQAVQSMLTAASRRDRMQTALWILNPSHPMPGPFLLAKQQKNILFDDLPRDLRFAPEFLKTDMIMNLLTGENGILNPRTPEDREIKKEFAAEVFEHFFPLAGNSAAETGLSNEALVLLKEMFVFALDKYDQGRGASIIDTLRSIEGQLSRKTYGERLAVLLGSLGPVGVKMGQILSENQELVPDARLRRDLGSLKHGAQSISKIAVIEALIAAGLDPAGFRVGRLLGSASMKQVHAGYLLIDGEWKEVVFKVLRPALNRTIDQDLEVLDAMFGEPSILEKIRVFVPGFEPEEMIRKIRFMIEEERDFLKEAANSRELAGVVESYPASFYSVRGLNAGMPRILKELPTVIVEERIRGLEAESLQHKGLFGRKARAKALKRQLTNGETRGILSLSVSRVKRLARNHFFYQVFYRGIFHADPHAGNLMVEAGQLVFIDAGLIGRLILPEQVEAARLLVKGVLLRHPDKVYEGFRTMLEAGGQQIEDPDGLRSAVAHAFRSSNFGNLNKLLNELGGIIARQQGPASAQAGAFIKAWTQALWLMPMTPATMTDLSNVLGLSRGEIIRTVLVTGMPNLVLQPFRALNQSFARVKSFFQDLRDALVRRVQLYRASLRLKKFQDSFSGLVSDLMNAVENKTQRKPGVSARNNRARNVMTDPPMIKAVVVHNGDRVPFERGEVERDARSITGASDAEIQEAAAVYSEYAAFLISSEGANNFLVQTELSEEDESHLQKLWEMQNGETRFRDDTQGPELVVRMLSRLYLAKKRQAEGKPYIDLLGFASPQQEYYARLLTKQYLASLDVEDQVSPIAPGPNGEVFRRRQIVLEKFLDYDPSEPGRKRTTPWLPFAFLDVFKASSHNVFMLKNPRARTPGELEQDYLMESVEEEALPPYANSRQIRGKLKRLQNERGAFFTDLHRNPQSVVVRTRERFTSPENPVTTRLDVHNFVRGETVTMFFTDAAFEEFIKTGRVQSFKRYRFAPSEALAGARSELRTAQTPGARSEDLRRYDVLSFLLGRTSVFVSREALADLSEKNLQRFQTVLSSFVREKEESFTLAGLDALRAEVTAPDFERRLTAELAAQMEQSGFSANSALTPVFTNAAARLAEKMRALLPENSAPAVSAEPLTALTAEGRALLGALGAVNPDTVNHAAVLQELKRLNPGKYGSLQTLQGVLGTAKENIPWMISLANLQGNESSVAGEVKTFLEERFEKAGLDFGILYRVGTDQETQVMALKQGLLKIWPVAARVNEPVKEAKLPAALRLGTGLYVLLSADQRLDPSAESSLVKAVHVAEDVVLADGFSAVEKIKITSLPLLNPHLEQQAPVLEGSRYRIVNRRVFNFLVDLINDLARLQSVQQIISASA